MRTIQMTLDDDLVKTVDRIAKETRTTRSAFTRDALRLALKHLKSMRLEERHRRGYASKPVSKNEFDVWEKEQSWGDE
ncbi:MAG TPA: CopG family transcriptional regulator [Lentisphaeria bacterium]|nr:MAG: CopG family transcriptional regulator [Lentisphaerae bacterium GWF2_49_21]HBC85898.1 CopG family transcriptional regulator [Lentisphaeria bacterium]